MPAIEDNCNLFWISSLKHIDPTAFTKHKAKHHPHWPVNKTYSSNSTSSIISHAFTTPKNNLLKPLIISGRLKKILSKSSNSSKSRNSTTKHENYNLSLFICEWPKPNSISAVSTQCFKDILKLYYNALKPWVFFKSLSILYVTTQWDKKTIKIS